MQEKRVVAAFDKRVRENQAKEHVTVFVFKQKTAYEVRKSRVLAAEYPYSLTFLFNDARVREIFAAFISDGGGEYRVSDYVQEEYGLSCFWEFNGHSTEFLGDGVVRVYSEAAETEKEDL